MNKTANQDREMDKGNERLLQLADRLLEIPIYEIDGKKVSNKRTLDKFIFSLYYRRNFFTEKTCGCAIGECPGLFDEWELDCTSNPVIKGKFYGTSAGGMDFFKINSSEYLKLFDSSFLGHDATAKEVAVNIINFVENRVFG